MNLLRLRAGVSAGPLLIPLSLSIALHAGALALLQPRSAWQPAPAGFDLRVRLARAEPAAAVPPAPPVRRKAAREAPRTGSLPRAAAPATTHEPQPLRMRIVANPADYDLAAPREERPYAWPGELTESPLPPEGFAVRYPEPQRRAGRKGLVVVRADFSSGGALEALETICSAPEFDGAVTQALRAARYSPPLSGARAVPAWAVLEFAFLAEADGKAGKDPREVERALAELQASCLRARAAAGG